MCTYTAKYWGEGVHCKLGYDYIVFTCNHECHNRSNAIKRACVIGDHIRIPDAFGTYHHMLVVEVIDDYYLRIIEYAECKKDSIDGASDAKDISGAAVGVVLAGLSSTACTSKAIIEHEVSLDERQVELLEYVDGQTKYTSKEAIARARSRLDEKEYNLFNNNCECLINWAYTDKSVSGQVIDAATKVGMGLVATGMVAALGYGLYKAFSGSSKKEEDSRQ